MGEIFDHAQEIQSFNLNFIQSLLAFGPRLRPIVAHCFQVSDILDQSISFGSQTLHIFVMILSLESHGLEEEITMGSDTRLNV